MQTDIKRSYDAALPGQLAVLPSFRGGAEVITRTVYSNIYPGDPVCYHTAQADDKVVTAPNGDCIGIAVRSHSNFQRVPQIDTTDGAYPVDKGLPIGVVINGPIWVRWGGTGTPKLGGYATPGTTRGTDGYIPWGVAAAGAKTRFTFASLPQQGNVIAVRVDSGAVQTAS
ncbi:hypothetical protein AB1226_001035 [Salmonella enterica subsp. enterica]|nr:hypothetical protein [Salmonella enterica]EBW9542994.1 hypothetical protein [Salmonella enterica subsp. enterica serovar Mississippi]ECD7290856.1 hypothetical protein [Salmonella enterica subsp. enterica serovar Agbeni]ECW0159705.1 hypothetical protein [Salmonella enterica subsp. enterica serovar Durham]EEC6738931.1 hypothetical protein [Salmonella enterica subsp. enterica serovar Telelkebir]EHS8052931.1 hypothetical protein [Salmonella enterica subsp. enterica]